MDSSNNKVSNILNTDSWSDALLVKDEKGNLAYLKPNKKEDLVNTSSQINHVSEGNLAPKDDSFLSMQNLSRNSQDKSELVFHPDDKSELDFFAKNIPQDDSKKYSIEKIVDRIIEKQKLAFDDKNKKIFSNILYNFFRVRKSVIISRELLARSVSIKNKKLNVGIIDNILSIVKGIKNKIDANGGLVVNKAELELKKNFIKPKPEIVEEILDSKDKSLSAQDEIKRALGNLIVPEEKIKLEPKIEATVKNIDQSGEDNLEKKLKKSKVVKESKLENKEIQPAEGFSIPAINGKLQKKEKALNIETGVKKDFPSKIFVKEEEAKETTTSLPKVSRGGINKTPKQSINDVVTPVKEEVKKVDPLSQKSILTGPVQELQSFDLVGFRRLGNSADERIQKILEKINLLEEESYTKKAQGITAWRASGAYKLYLQLGTESMVAEKEVADFIAEQEDKNKDTLSIEEFSAISDLNKQLRF